MAPATETLCSKRLGSSPLSLNYTRHVVPLVEADLLAVTVPDKSGSKAQRFRISPTPGGPSWRLPNK